MTKDFFIKTFLIGAGLEPDTSESFAIGLIRPIWSADGVLFLMERYIALINKLTRLLPNDDPFHKELQYLRGFSFKQYQQLFNSSIKEDDFSRFPIFFLLGIFEEHERKRLIYHLSDISHEDYLRLLCSQNFHAHTLKHFFLANVPSCAYQARWSTHRHHRAHGQWKIKIAGAYVLRNAEKVWF